jgi:aromatic ring-opening dioxygenase catalytic subunit (LigB family)
MLISHALLVPHRPTLLVDEHRQHRTEMLEALERASERLRAEAPAVVVAVSARWEGGAPFQVDAGRRHRTITDYSGLGVEVRYDCAGHPVLARALVEAGQKAGVRVAAAEHGVDSGISVPMHFLIPARDVPVVPLSVAPRTAAECRAWGRVVRSVLAAWPERAAFVVGGGLSNNEHAWNLNREVPEAREFDEQALDSLRQGGWDDLSERLRPLAEKARPEAELRHLELLRGFLAGDVRGEVRGYESGPGVGSALVEFPVAQVVEVERS